MAFASDITLNPTTYGGANTDKTFSLVGYEGTSAALRRAATDGLSTPNTLRIAHRVTGKTTDEHLTRLDAEKANVAGVNERLSMWTVIRVPRGTTFTAQERLDMKGRLIAFLQASGNFDKLLNGEL